MKRKIIISIFSLPLLSLAFIFMSANTANAGCCADTCTPADSQSDCSTNNDYTETNCTSLEQCQITVAPTQNGCCVKGNTCMPPNTEGACPADYTPNPTDCSNIEACSSSASGTGATTTTFKNPIAFKTVSELLNSILDHLLGIIAIIAVIFIIIGGVMYMMSGGSETMITRAKKTWTGAVIGFAIALASPTFLKEIQKILGGNGTNGNAQQWVSNALTIKQIAVNVLNLLLSVIGIVAIIALVIGGGMYLTAYGNEKKIDTGKRITTYAIIGIAVSLAALVIVHQVAHLLGAG